MKTEEIIIQRLNSIERKLQKLLSTDDRKYISEREAAKRYGVSVSNLRKARYSGRLTDYTHTETGRNFRYSVSELNKVFSIKLKTA
jgi:hypothetical protein